MRRHIAYMMCVFSLCAATMSGAAPTRAEGTSQTAAGKSAAPAAAEQHCVDRPKQPLECFKTEAEALYAASGGRIRLPEGGSARSLSDEELFGTAGSEGTEDTTSTIQAILYKDADYGGASLSIVSDTCSGWNNLSSTWNDVTSSARVSSGCNLTLYEHTNLGGSSLSISPPGTTYVGNTMNDKTSSWALP
ncbi:MAG: hypothetical protein M3441_11170 [Chloroflexota bacterium]|nr:hypothetical protein [Chloroflexota bacterium]